MRIVHSQRAERSFHLFAHGTFLLAGVSLLCLAWFVPMNVFGMSFVFSVHMSQHLLLSLAVPPLLLLSIPVAYWHTVSRRLGAHQGIRRAALLFLASALFNANIWLWHAPPLFQAMMQSNGLHLLSDASYLATGLLFWLPLFISSQQTHYTLSIGAKLAYFFFSDMPMMLIGAGLTISPPLYMMPMMGRLMPITAFDQQLGGLLMWIVGSLFFIVIASSLFLRWLLKQERMEQEVEALRGDVEEPAQSVENSLS